MKVALEVNIYSLLMALWGEIRSLYHLLHTDVGGNYVWGKATLMTMDNNLNQYE